MDFTIPFVLEDIYNTYYEAWQYYYKDAMRKGE